MTATSIPTVDLAEREIVIERIFDAPRSLVFKAWTDPRHITQWWGPKGFTNTTREMDVRPSGVWRYVMHGPDGTDYDNKIVYREVVEPERLVYAHGDEGDAEPFEVTVTFDAQDSKTKLTMRMIFPSAEEREKAVREVGAIDGANQTLDRLEEELAKMSTATSNMTVETKEREVIFSRVFDAPRELVFKAFSQPEHLVHWWGPKGWTLPVCNLDFRPGGIWHFCMEGPNGEQSWGKAIYREIVEPERIVYEDYFSDAEGNVVEGMPQVLATVEFTEQDGKTKVTNYAQYSTVEELQTVMEMGMAEGVGQTWDRLAEYLPQLRA